MTVFYDHLLDYESVKLRLPKGLSEADSVRLIETLDACIHHEVLSAILSRIPSSVHEVFIASLSSDPSNPDHWVFLRKHAPQIDQVVSATVTRCQQKYLDAIHRVA